MHRFGIYVLNIVFLFAFAVAVEVSNPGGATEAVGYGVAFLALLFFAMIGHAFLARRAGQRGLNAYQVILSGAAFLALAGLSGQVGWGMLAGLQMLLSLAVSRPAMHRVIEPAPIDQPVFYTRQPDGSFKPLNPSAPQSRQVH